MIERIVWILVILLIAFGIATLVVEGSGVFSHALVHISDGEELDRV